MKLKKKMYSRPGPQGKENTVRISTVNLYLGRDVQEYFSSTDYLSVSALEDGKIVLSPSDSDEDYKICRKGKGASIGVGTLRSHFNIPVGINFSVPVEYVADSVISATPIPEILANELSKRGECCE